MSAPDMEAIAKAVELYPKFKEYGGCHIIIEGNVGNYHLDQCAAEHETTEEERAVIAFLKTMTHRDRLIAYGIEAYCFDFGAAEAWVDDEIAFLDEHSDPTS